LGFAIWRWIIAHVPILLEISIRKGNRGDERDDGQQFGLKTRVNAAEQLKMKVGEERISDVRIDDATSDLAFQFGQSLRLEVISASSGYEAWSLQAKVLQIIGRNGDTVVFSSPKSI
jgi:hypothetical protein